MQKTTIKREVVLGQAAGFHYRAIVEGETPLSEDEAKTY